jgi:hypothetical protein
MTERAHDVIDDLVRLPGPLVLGEIHGTVEIPALVTAVMDRAVAAGRPVRLCLEVPDAVIAVEPPGDPAELPTDSWWRWNPGDGRSSRAMAELVRHARSLEPRDVACVALQPDQVAESELDRWERIMARRLVAACRPDTGAFVLALVGNAHSRLVDSDRLFAAAPMAALAREELPELCSLLIVTTGGTAWVMRGGDQASGCPTWFPAAPGSDASPGVHWSDGIGPHQHSGTWVTGPITASPPLAGGT